MTPTPETTTYHAKLMKDATAAKRDNFTVYNPEEEKEALAAGFEAAVPEPHAFGVAHMGVGAPAPVSAPAVAATAAPTAAESAPTVGPAVPILPPINATIMVGAQLPAQSPNAPFEHPVRPQNKTGLIKHFDTVCSLFERMSIPSDGSMVMLRPGTALPFPMWAEPYRTLLGDNIEGTVPNALVTLLVVPNRPDQLGAGVPAAPIVPPPPAAPKPPAPPFGAKLLRDPNSNKPDLLVKTQADYDKAVADGYTVEIPAPASA